MRRSPSEAEGAVPSAAVAELPVALGLGFSSSRLEGSLSLGVGYAWR